MKQFTVITLIAALLASIVLLSGCVMASRTIVDVDKHIVEITSKDTAPTACIAGFYAGVSYGTDNLKISKAVTELISLVDTNDADYKRCKAKGLEVSILAVSGKENLDDAIQKIMSLGLF